METVISLLGAEREECFFWATHAGAEIDLYVTRGRRRLGFEFKRTDAPTVTKSMRVAMDDLALTALVVIHAVERSFALADKIEALSIHDLIGRIKRLR